MKQPLHIEIVRSMRPEFSSMGTKSCAMIETLLKQHYSRVGITIINSPRELKGLVAKKPDLVFLGMKNISLELDGGPIWLSEYLDKNGITYTGSNVTAIKLDFDKPSAKLVVSAAGLDTAGHFVTKPNQYSHIDTLPLSYPLFIKPPSMGGGGGVGADSVVRTFLEFTQKVQNIADSFNSHSLVESYLPGREFSVAILESVEGATLIMPIEVITEANAAGDRILGAKIKDDDNEQIVTINDPLLRRLITNLAAKVFKALGARDYGRIDIRLDEHGVPHFLEANLIPGLAQHDFTSYFTSACHMNESMDYDAMILHIVRLGEARAIRKTNTFLSQAESTKAHNFTL
jgi:D-alanine-D-alanine ligase